MTAILWLIMPYFVVNTVCQKLLDLYSFTGIHVDIVFPSFSVIISFSVNLYRAVVMLSANEEIVLSLPTSFYIYLVLNFVLTAVFLPLSLVVYSNKKREKIGDISDSWLSYRTLIPMLGLSLVLMHDVIPVPVTVIIMLVLYSRYRRSAKFRLPDYIAIAAAVILALTGLSAPLIR